MTCLNTNVLGMYHLSSSNCHFNPESYLLKNFRAYELKLDVSQVSVHNRRDVHRISLVRGKSLFCDKYKTVEIIGSVLFFEPQTSLLLKSPATNQTHYSCLFTDDFLEPGTFLRSLNGNLMNKLKASPFFVLNNSQSEFVASLFQKMIAEQNTPYRFKNELLSNCVQLIVHEAIKTPSLNIFQ